MRYAFRLLLLSVCFSSALAVAPVRAQTTPDTTAAHRLPFGSTGNAVELTVVNPTGTALSGVRVVLQAAPTWLRFASQAAPVGELEADAEPAVVFQFDVLPGAPVGIAADVMFEVQAGTTIVARRAFRVAVDAPQEVALIGPWPNPVRSSGRLAIELPVAGHARVVLYDVLGRQVARLLDEERPAGRHEVALDASGLAAGMYVVRVEARDAAGAGTTRTRRLTVLR